MRQSRAEGGGEIKIVLLKLSGRTHLNMLNVELKQSPGKGILRVIILKTRFSNSFR